MKLGDIERERQHMNIIAGNNVRAMTVYNVSHTKKARAHPALMTNRIYKWKYSLIACTSAIWPGMVDVLGPWLAPVEAVVSEPTAGARMKSMSPSVDKTKTQSCYCNNIMIVNPTSFKRHINAKCIYVI